MRRLISIAVLLAVFAFVPLAAQDDGEPRRKGFIIGFGIGPGLTSDNPGTKAGLATDFKIGGTVGESVLVYYHARGGLLGTKFGHSTLSTFAGLGVAYEIPSVPRSYVNGGVGLSSWYARVDGETDRDYGLGLSGGFGYEFVDHFLFDVGATWGEPVESFNGFKVMAGISILSH